MFQININDKNKRQRIGSTKKLQLDNPRSASTTSRRNISNRSQYTQKNMSTIGGEYAGACCSGHGGRPRNQSTLYSSKGFLNSMDQLSTVIMKNSAKKQTNKVKNSANKGSKGKNINSSVNLTAQVKSKSKLQNYTKNIINSAVNKIKQQKTNRKITNKTKSSKKILKQSLINKIQPNHKKSYYDEIVEVPLQDEKIKLTQINPFISGSDNKMRRRNKIVSVDKDKFDESAHDFNRISYLKRQGTPQKIQQQSRQGSNINQNKKLIEKSQNLSPQNVGRPSLKIAQSQATIPQKQYNQVLKQLILKKQAQKCHEQTIHQLKLNNSKLQQQLFDSYKKYQCAIDTQYSSIKQVQTRKINQIEKLQLQIRQNKLKINQIQKQCQRLRKQKQILIEKYNNQINMQRKQRSNQKEQLLRKILIIQEKYCSLQSLCANLDKQNKELKENSLKYGTEKQKYENAMKKFERQINSLEDKLEIQVKKNRQNEKQLVNLRKQKQYIKQNSQLILQLVRNQLKECETSKRQISESNENEGKYQTKLPSNIDKKGLKQNQSSFLFSPNKHNRVLGQYNF